MLRPLSRSTLLPYTTLFRSGGGRAPMRPAGTGRVRREIQGGGLVGGGRGAGQREYSGEQSRGPNIGRHGRRGAGVRRRSEEHTSELQSPCNLVCRLLLEKIN